MKVEQIEVERLTAHPKNSRVHSREQITALGRAMTEWGVMQPVVADENLVILIGHGRVEAAKSIGLKTIPVLVRKGLSDAKKRALLISDNRLAELGSSWDEGILADELRWLLDSDFDITLTAFDLPEIPPERILGVAPESQQERLVSVPGDVWHLGPHRLGCAIGGAQAGVLDGAPGLLVMQVRDGDLEAAAAALGATEAPVAYVWHQPATGGVLAKVLEAAGFEIRSQIIRDREHASGSRNYAPGHDPCWYAVRKGTSAGYIGGRSQSTLWRLPSSGRDLPVECWKRPIQNHLALGGVVIDPLAGSGSVFIAAHQTARVAAGLEIDPAACDLAVTRWEQFTAREAIHGGTGKTYRATAEARGAAEGESEDPPVASEA